MSPLGLLGSCPRAVACAMLARALALAVVQPCSGPEAGLGGPSTLSSRGLPSPTHALAEAGPPTHLRCVLLSCHRQGPRGAREPQ